MSGPKSMPVFPPTEASTMANKDVGMFMKSIPRLKSTGYKASQIGNHTTTEIDQYAFSISAQAGKFLPKGHTCFDLFVFFSCLHLQHSKIKTRVCALKCVKQCTFVLLSVKTKTAEKFCCAIILLSLSQLELPNSTSLCFVSIIIRFLLVFS